MDDVGGFTRRFKLTPRQRDVLSMLVEGLAPKQMAERLAISHVTIRRHAEEIYRRCGTSNQRETLALFARIVMLGHGAPNEGDQDADPLHRDPAASRAADRPEWKTGQEKTA